MQDQNVEGRRQDDVKSDRRNPFSRIERARERVRESDWRRRRDLLTKWRQPIIGLTVAGAALPMAGGGINLGGEPQDAESKATTALTPVGAALEEHVNAQAAAANAAAEGRSAVSETVDDAVQRYKIAPDLAEDIVSAAMKNGIEPDLALGLVKTESSFNERAKSHVGARGLTQVMPRTGAWLQPGTSAEDLYDRKINLDLGFRYLRDLIDKYDGNERLALLAYNRGPGTVDKVLKRGGDPNNGYADKVFGG